MSYTGSNKRVVKNTIILSIRMVVVMIIGLFTSRLLLKYLGVEDYGLYNVVGAVIGMMSLVNGVLSGSGTRYLTYSLGEDGSLRLKQTFTTMMNVQIIMAIITAVVLLTLGAWVLDGKSNIPPSRLDSVNFSFYCVIFSTVFTLLVVPFNSAVVAYERMSAFAWLTFLDVFTKLGVVYLLSVATVDRLKLYAALVAGIQVVHGCITVGYCLVQFKNLRYIRYFDLRYLLEIYSFAGLAFLRCGVGILLTQCVTVLNQRYFGAALVAAFALAITIWGQIKAFINNYRAAANPQIIKLFSAGKFAESRNMMVNTALLSFFIYLVFAIPLFVFADEVLGLWLETVPERTVGFVRIVLVTGIAAVFEDCFYTAIAAKGRMVEYTLWTCITGIVTFVLIWLLISVTGNPYIAALVLMARCMFCGFVMVPFVLKRVVGYMKDDFRRIFIPSAIVMALSFLIGLGIWWIAPRGVCGMFIFGPICALAVCGVCWRFGVPFDIRIKLLSLVKMKLGI